MESSGTLISQNFLNELAKARVLNYLFFYPKTHSNDTPQHPLSDLNEGLFFFPLVNIFMWEGIFSSRPN